MHPLQCSSPLSRQAPAALCIKARAQQAPKAATAAPTIPPLPPPHTYSLAASMPRDAPLQEDNARLKHTLEAAEACVREYEQELHLVRATVDSLRSCLSAKEGATAMQGEQVVKVRAAARGWGPCAARWLPVR